MDEVVVVPTVLDDGRPQGTTRPPLRARIANKFGRPLDLAGASTKARAHLARGGFDVLWVEKALALAPDVVRDARTMKVFASEDDMTQKHNQSSFFRECLPHYDLVMTTKPRNAAADGLPRIGAREVLVVPKTFDPELHRPIELSEEERREFGSTIAFVGSYERERASDLSRLADAGFDLRVWGNGWAGRDVSPKLVIEGRPVVGEDYARVLSAAPIHLCFLRKANDDQSTGRSVEIPASGALLVAERTREHASLFEEDHEAVFFQGFDELSSKLATLVDDPETRARIAERGRARVHADGRSHVSTVDRILARLGELR